MYELYAQARKWVVGIDPKTELAEESITHHEEPVSPYQTKILVIHHPTCKAVRMISRGRWIIGAEGHVVLKSELGTQTLLYVTAGEPSIRIHILTENSKILDEVNPSSLKDDIAEGWGFVQDRQIGMLPSLDMNLFHRLLEVRRR